MSEFEVGCEGEGLRHGDVAPCFEHHHCDWTAWACVANYELCYYAVKGWVNGIVAGRGGKGELEADLLIGDCLNHPDGNDIDEGFRWVSLCFSFS